MTTKPYFKACPEDFLVEEIPLYPTLGEGPHTFLRIEKRLRTTDQVARALAHAVGCSGRDVGYAGRKDHMAVTRQWFSVPDFDPELAETLELAGASVLEATRHQNKLRTGHLKGNRFEIWVRGVPPDRLDDANCHALSIDLDAPTAPHVVGTVHELLGPGIEHEPRDDRVERTRTVP